MSRVEELPPPQRPQYFYYLAGALVGALFFGVIAFGSGAIWNVMEADIERCSAPSMFLDDSDECLGMLHPIVISTAYPLSIGPGYLLQFLPIENELFVSAILSALIGAICIGLLKIKRGMIAFLVVYTLISSPLIMMMSYLTFAE